MEENKSIAKLAEALSKAQGEMGNAIKDSDNPFFKSKFCSLSACMGVIREPFFNHGLSVTQPIVYLDGKSFVKTILLHSSGESIEGLMPLPNIADIQKLGGAVTYLRRYSLCSVAGITPADDDDGNSAAKEAKIQEDIKRKEKIEADKKKQEEELISELDKLKSLLVEVGDEDTEKKTLEWAQVDTIEQLPLGRLKTVNLSLSKKLKEKVAV